MFEANLHDGIHTIFEYIKNISDSELTNIKNKAYEVYELKYNNENIFSLFSKGVNGEIVDMLQSGNIGGLHNELELCNEQTDIL